MAVKTKMKGKLSSLKISRKGAAKDVKEKVSKLFSKASGVVKKRKQLPVKKAAIIQNSKLKVKARNRKVLANAVPVKKVDAVASGLAVKKSNKSVVARTAKQFKVLKGRNATAHKVISRITKPCKQESDVEMRIAGIRDEFKRTLKAEIAAAFDVCLAAIEQAVNLMESRLATVLGEMSNLVTGAKPKFKSGKLESVVSEDGKETTNFSYERDGLVISRTYRDGKLRFEIVHGKLGNPLRGKMFGPSGNVVKEFSYGPDGQVK